MNNNIIKVYIVGGDTSYANLFLDKIEIVDNIPDANIILFTGGEDVYPGNYGESTGSRTHYNRTRDNAEIKSFDEARRYNKFIVAICRGSQLITILSGGSLIQHVSNHAINGTHKIHLMNEDVDIDITSTHHQMMWPFWMDKGSYTILAKSTIDLSTTYLDGEDSEKDIPKDFVEPEIVYYNRTNCLCIQGHPEYMPKDSIAVKYINVLIREYLEDTVEIIPEVINEIEAPNVDDGILRQINNINVQRVELDDINWDAARVRLNAIQNALNNIQAVPPRPRRAPQNMWVVDPFNEFN